MDKSQFIEYIAKLSLTAILCYAISVISVMQPQKVIHLILTFVADTD